MDTLISVLGGAISKKQGVWHTNGPDDPGDMNGVTLDRFRVLAAAHLYKQNPQETTLLAQGGLAEDLKPSIGSVIRDELKALGVPEERILLEERSHSTYSQLVELQSIVVKREPTLCLIVSNEWHLPRIEAMIKWIPELQRLSKLKPQLKSAEEVLIQENENLWQPLIETLRQRDDIIRRVSKERQGVVQIEKGMYKYK